jgi:hypothetical protein
MAHALAHISGAQEACDKATPSVRSQSAFSPAGELACSNGLALMWRIAKRGTILRRTRFPDALLLRN